LRKALEEARQAREAAKLADEQRVAAIKATAEVERQRKETAEAAKRQAVNYHLN
jgi:hypothetical protein